MAGRGSRHNAQLTRKCVFCGQFYSVTNFQKRHAIDKQGNLRRRTDIHEVKCAGWTVVPASQL